jgi:hypothetical protein
MLSYNLDYIQKEAGSSSFQSNDGYLLDSERVGNFEWWYFDCIDIRENCMLKIVVHLGTDPLRRRFYPTLALSIKTPDATRAIELQYGLKDFKADKNRCDLHLREDCHIYSDPENPGTYHIEIDIPEFKATLTFERTIPVWVPPTHRMQASLGKRKSEFFWNVLQPGSLVNGSFEYKHSPYTLKNAIGYHDHNYWQLKSRQGLFIEELITRWYWGKCVLGPFTVVFMEIWMKGERVNSIMVAEKDKIVFSTDKNLTFLVDEEILYAPLKRTYASQINIKSNNDEFPLKLILSCEELIDSKDLLKGVNPLIAWLIKRMVARPAYFGIKSSATLEIPNQNLAGFGNYEIMLFR